jgi:LDH2 family malate/lactate/ureidoglycolate dehydrogenase
VQPSQDPGILIPAATLRPFASRILAAAGTPPAYADLIADTFVAANLRAVDSHGVQLLNVYVETIQNGNINLHATGRLVNETGGCALYDGENGIGQVVSLHCCDHAVRLARTHGIGFVTVRESNHFGAAAYWAQKLASQNMLAIVMCNATPLVAPWQGREPRLGTNPICMALPGPPIWLLDMATTTVALNRIWKAAANGEPEIPTGWAMDKDGVPTTSTQEALQGLPMPLGGYKGTGLAILVEILCGVLSGGAMATELGGLRVRSKPMRVGHAFIAVDIARFMPLDVFTERMQRFGESIKHTAPARGYDEVLLAGEPEWRAEALRLENGIPISRPIWNKLLDLAASLNVTPPHPAEIME